MCLWKLSDKWLYYFSREQPEWLDVIHYHAQTNTVQQALMDEAKHYNSVEEAKARLIQVARRTAGQRVSKNCDYSWGAFMLRHIYSFNLGVCLH